MAHPGQVLPFTHYDATNHQPGIWVASIFCPLAASVFLGIRFYARSRNFKPELLWNVAIFIVASAHWACMLAALHLGAGKAVSLIGLDNFRKAGHLVFASRILLLLFECFSRIFFLHFLRHIFHIRRSQGRSVWDWGQQQGYFKLYFAFLCFFIASLLVNPLIASVGCKPGLFLNGSEPGYCVHDFARWDTVTVISGVSELAPLLLSVLSVRKLETSFRRKLDICLILGTCRLLPLAILIVYDFAYHSFRNSGVPSLSSSSILIYQQVLLATSALSLCIPVLRNFGSQFNNGGLGGIHDGSYGPKSKSVTGSSPGQSSLPNKRASITGGRLNNIFARALDNNNNNNNSSSHKNHHHNSHNNDADGYGSYGVHGCGPRSFANEPDMGDDIGRLGQTGESEAWVRGQAGVEPSLQAVFDAKRRQQQQQQQQHQTGGAAVNKDGVMFEEVEMRSRSESQESEHEAGGRKSGDSQCSRKIILCRKEYEVKNEFYRKR